MTSANPATPAPDLRIGSLFSRSWRAFKTRPWFLAWITLFCCILMPAVFGALSELMKIFVFGRGHAGPGTPLTSSFLQGFAGGVFQGIFHVMFFAGMMHITMRIWKEEDAWFSLSFYGFSRFLRILGLILVGGPVTLVAIVAFILLIIPAVAAFGTAGIGAVLILLAIPYTYLMVAFGPALVVILESNLGTIEALRIAWRLTQGYRGQLVLVFISSSLVGMLGTLALVVGLLVTIPLNYFMLMGAYDELVKAYTRKVEAAAPAPEAAQAVQA